MTAAMFRYRRKTGSDQLRAEFCALAADERDAFFIPPSITDKEEDHLLSLLYGFGGAYLLQRHDFPSYAAMMNRIVDKIGTRSVRFEVEQYHPDPYPEELARSVPLDHEVLKDFFPPCRPPSLASLHIRPVRTKKSDKFIPARTVTLHYAARLKRRPEHWSLQVGNMLYSADHQHRVVRDSCILQTAIALATWPCEVEPAAQVWHPQDKGSATRLASKP